MTEERKKRLKAIGIFGGTFSLIVSLFISCAVNEELTLNPIRWLIGIFKYGFPFKYFIALGALFVFMIVYIDYKLSHELEKDDRDFLYSKSGTYGTAKLLRTAEAIKEVAKIQPPAYARGTIFGQMDLSGKKIINLDMDSKENHRNKHVAVFGASSSGKTFSYVKPFCIQAVRCRESLIITDPKGELYEDTVQYFKDSGYVVRRFDLKNLALSDGWDILKEIRGDPDRADILAKIIWNNISDGSSGGIFESGPVSLLKAILLRVALDDKMKERGMQNIGEAYNMLQNPQGEDYLNEQFNPVSLDEKTQACIGPYMSYKQGSPNMRGNILITLSSLLNVFQSETVRAVTSTDDIDLTLPGKVPCVYYCILPDMHSTYNFIGAVFFSFLFLDLVEYADNTPERKCKVPVNFLLDEFANIGSIPEFDKKLATIRSRALNVSIILQDLPQLMGRYPETYKSILSNCATYVCIGCNDSDTATFFSDRAGETTIQVRTDQHEKAEPAINMGTKHSTGEGKRKIFTNDELITFGMDECLIVWQALYTMRAYKYPYNIHPEAKRMKRVSILDYLPITDTKGRKKLREEEKERVAAYEAKLKTGWNPFEYFGGTMYSVPDKEIEESQHLYWYEQVWLELIELEHKARVYIKKAVKRYEKEKMEVRDRITNDNYVDPSVVVEEEPDEDFVVVTTDVEDWDLADISPQEELQEEFCDDTIDSAIVETVEEGQANGDNFNVDMDTKLSFSSDDNLKHDVNESYISEPPDNDNELDEDIGNPMITPDVTDGSFDYIDDKANDELREDINPISEEAVNQEDCKEEDNDLVQTFEKPHTDMQNESQTAKSEILEPTPDKAKTKQENNLETPQSSDKALKTDVSDASDAPKLLTDIDLDWGILGDKADYKLKQVDKQTPGGSAQADRVILDTLALIYGGGDVKQDKADKPKVVKSDCSRKVSKEQMDKAKKNKEAFSVSIDNAKMLQALISDQARHSVGAKRSGVVKNERKK